MRQNVWRIFIYRNNSYRKKSPKRLKQTFKSSIIEYNAGVNNN